MNATLERRIKQAEDKAISLKPFVPKSMVLVGQPAEDATPERWAKYKQELATAELEHDQVIVLVGISPGVRTDPKIWASLPMEATP